MRAIFADLYRTHASDLLAWFKSRTFSGEVAADLVAETFAAALSDYGRFDADRGSHGAWLWGIARNQLLKYHRFGAVEARARRRLAIRTPRVHDDDLDALDAELDAFAERDRLRAALDDLGPGVAAAVRARVFDRLSYDEVARVCGCTPGTARVRVSRGLTTLLDRLGDRPAGEVNR